MIDTQDQWSGSETASMPEQEIEPNELTHALFDCREHESQLPYLSANHLKRFVFSEVSSASKDINIFGVSCDSNIIFDDKERKHHFQLVKIHLFELLNHSLSQQNFSFKGSLSAFGMKTLRKQLAGFISMLFSAVKICKGEFNEAMYAELAKDLISLVKPVGNIFHSPQWIDIEEKNTTNYHLFHIRLELKVHLLLLLSTISSNEQNSSGKKCAIEIRNSLIMDILIVSNMHYTKMKRRIIDIWMIDAFLCACCKQAWVVIIQISKQFQRDASSDQSVWSVVSKCLSDENKERDRLQNRNNFQWNSCGEMKVWLMSSLASLYWIDMCGNNTYNEKMVVPGDWITVQDILKKELPKDQTGDTLKQLLWSCIKFTIHWMPNLDVFNRLMDYFNKNLDYSSNRTSTIEITSYMQKHSSLDPTSQLDSVLSLMVVSDIPNGDDSSYDMFLRFVFRMIRRLKDIQSQQMLSQVKKRIYNKFHKRRVLELNQHGLYRFVSLFTILALTLNDTDIVAKMITLLATRTFNNNTLQADSTSVVTQCRKQVICSNFMVLHLCAKQNNVGTSSTNSVVSCIVQRFLESTKHLIDSKMNKELFQSNMDLIQYIFKIIEQYFDYNKFNEDCLPLFCPAYKHLLCHAVEFQYMDVLLTHLNRLISVILNDDGISNDLKSKIWAVFYEVFYESLEQIYCNKRVTEVFAGLTLLSIESNASHTQQFLQKHAFDESKELVHRTLFMRKLLNSQSANVHIETSSHTSSVIKVWLSCCIWLPDESVLFTKYIVQLPTVSKYVLNKQCEEFNDVIIIVSQFISGLGKYYNSVDTVTEMSSIRKFLEKSFSGFVKDAEQVLTKNTESSSAVRTAFEISGKLVKHCAKAIYNKTSPMCLLPQLIDLFILPLKYAKKPLPDYTKISNRYLHYFLQGISWLDTKRDSFVIRKMRDITQRYFIGCCMASYQNQLDNPFLISLLPSCSENPMKHFSEYRAFMLGHITEIYLVMRQSPQTLASILSFMVQLITTTKSQKEMFDTVKLILKKILSCVLVCDAARSKGEPVNVKNFAVKILKTIRNLNGEESHKLICDVVKNFVNDHFQNYQNTVLKTLQTVYITCPAVVKDILNDVDGIVYENERKRGVGVDSELRHALKELHALIDAGTNGT